MHVFNSPPEQHAAAGFPDQTRRRSKTAAAGNCCLARFVQPSGRFYGQTMEYGEQETGADAPGKGYLTTWGVSPGPLLAGNAGRCGRC
jgi:hypothetical protein